MNKTITLTTPQAIGNINNDQLGFRAESCIVQNLSNSYWYLPNEQSYILPHTTQVVIAPIGETTATIVYQAPAGRQQPESAAAVGTASFIFTDTPLPPASGLQDNMLTGQDSVISLAAGTNNNSALGFLAQTVTVNNPTASWWYLPDQNTYIPPFTTGLTISGLNTLTSNIQWGAPQGQNQASATAPGIATFTYTASVLGSTTGSPSATEHAVITVTLPANQTAINVQIPVAINKIDIFFSPNGVGSGSVKILTIQLELPSSFSMAFDSYCVLYPNATQFLIGNRHIIYDRVMPALSMLTFTLNIPETVSTIFWIIY